MSMAFRIERTDGVWVVRIRPLFADVVAWVPWRSFLTWKEANDTASRAGFLLVG